MANFTPLFAGDGRTGRTQGIALGRIRPRRLETAAREPPVRSLASPSRRRVGTGRPARARGHSPVKGLETLAQTSGPPRNCANEHFSRLRARRDAQPTHFRSGQMHSLQVTWFGYCIMICHMSIICRPRALGLGCLHDRDESFGWARGLDKQGYHTRRIRKVARGPVFLWVVLPGPVPCHLAGAKGSRKGIPRRHRADSSVVEREEQRRRKKCQSTNS